jgi:sialate O-acetylesterase
MLKPSVIFSDGMVLQRDRPVKVWGAADPGALVTVSLGGNRQYAAAGANGRWLAELPAMSAGGPYELQIASAGEQISVKDVLLGDVWLLSGQSNMAVSLIFARKDFESLSGQEFPAIRQFGVPFNMNFKGPAEEFTQMVMNFSTENIPSDDSEDEPPPMPPFPPSGVWLRGAGQNLAFFSAIGFFFAKKVYEKYRVPIGLVQTSMGGVPVEAYMSRDALRDYPLDLAEADYWADDDHIKQIALDDARRMTRWNDKLDRLDPGVQEGWEKPEYDDGGWNTAGLTDDWAAYPNMPDCGAVWFRRTIEVPPELAGKKARLSLGMLVEGDRCYVNGILAGRSDTRWFNSNYPIKGGLKAGKNVVVIRLLSQRNLGRAVPGSRPESTQRIVFPDMPDRVIQLDDQSWKYRPGGECGFLLRDTTVFYKATGLYNAMLAPLHKYPIKGALWYQGESNTDRPNTYADHFIKMVEDWRVKWGEDFPVFWVQLPNFAPMELDAVNWAYLREEERRCLALKNSGMAVAIDVGETWDIHPVQKAILGERLALAALKVAYGENILHSGPVFAGIEINQSGAVLRFESTGGALAARGGGELRGFAVFDGEKQYPARAEIRGETILVSCAPAKRIAAVRYAWESDPAGANLINKEGIPASPFDSQLSLWPGTRCVPRN